MGINILSSEIYNKISAGEVVERPASVVKELVENSIDGGATKISVEIYGGGIDKIIVTDNGCGIEPDEIEKAFLPHATSKIQNEEDLFSISSLGFRGEALASIAAVSKVEVFSKTENNEFGIALKINGGKFEEKREVGFQNGTRMVVSNLFYNTPARLKFLKKPKNEEGEITNLISKIIMANPEISIRYSADDKIIYNTFGNGLAEAMYIIYGKETYDNLLQIDYERDGVRLYGFIARPTFCKPNRTYQTIFVNGRVVSNYMISAAVQDALEGYIMKGKFPLFALNISVPFDTVDVNVHPSKQEVKFQFPNKIYSIVNNAVFNVVSNANFIQNTEIDLRKEGENNLKFENENKEIILDLLSKNSKKNSPEIVFKSSKNLLSKIYLEKLLKNQEKSIENNQEKSENNLENFTFEEIEIKTEEKLQKIDENNQEKIENVFESYKLIGVLFETYILIEKNGNFLIIDQHAAHERQLYDKFKAEIETSEIPVQQLLVPYVFSVNQKEFEFLENNLNLLTDFGIEISAFGDRTFKVSSVPSILCEIDLKNFFENVLDDVSGYLKKPIDIIRKKIATSACRAAVKAGDKLSEREIKDLLKNFKENGNVLLCPHGRPVIVSFSKNEIEKWFKRIV